MSDPTFEPTTDICDRAERGETIVQVVDPATRFLDFGASIGFSGPAHTVRVYEDNVLVRAALEEPGDGRVLVVDAGGSARRAMLGDVLGRFGVENGWAGIVLYGYVRDAAELASLDIGIKALGTNPQRSEKRGEGVRAEPVRFLGVTVREGDLVTADADGIVISPRGD